MYDEEEYYEETGNSSSDVLLTIFIAIGSFLLLIFLLYLKFNQ